MSNRPLIAPKLSSIKWLSIPATAAPPGVPSPKPAHERMKNSLSESCMEWGGGNRMKETAVKAKKKREKKKKEKN